eukprot:TRINITY_DN1454_c0_g1_i5.p1 TRINITY_DN1454_c0_g1~~TRINITY_DN1454_c0_g1_i5.p1  ORF type:complete len:962 (-),score=331.96 TRINITY_DN1454_c0_g1_i5:501-3386(-)
MAMFDLPDVLGLSASQERIISNYDSLDSSDHYQGETSNMNGVGDMPPSLSQSLTGDMPACMTQSMQVTPSPAMSDMPPDIMTTSTNSLNFKTGKKSVPNRNGEGRAESSAKEKEREDKVRRIREQQEDERKKKLEELKQHALHAQKFREQQENERRRHIDELRSKDMDRRQQVEERRKEIERSELERREAILSKNREREGRLETQRKNSRGNIEFAFGSSAPRLIEPRIDSSSGYWGSRRATSSTNVHSVTGPGMFERSQRSMDREMAGGDFKAKRTASAQGLDRSTEGEENGIINSSGQTAHRRRTDLVPTIVMSRNDGMSRSGTPSTKHRSPGRAVSMSRIDQLSRPRQPKLAQHASNHPTNISPSKSMSHLAVGATKTARRPFSLLTNSTSQSHLNGTRSRAKTVGQSAKPKEGISRENSTASRPGSAMSGRGGVRLRSAPGGARRPRPMSIATTGMTASMYEERQKPAHVPRQKSSGTPKADRMKRARSVTSDTGGIEDDNRSTTSSQSVGPTNRTPTRKTPSQVKAEAAARKAKATAGKPAVSTPKSSLGSRGGTERKTSSSKSPSPALSQDNIDNNTAVPNNDTESNKRQSTPDILKDNNRKVENTGEVKYNKDNMKNGSHEEVNRPTENNNVDKEKSPETDNEGEVKESKKMITSEEEAKARIAEKRREMKEQKEREAELERLRLEEEARLEEERLKQEEEEERKMIAFAEEARKAEEERIRKAIEEKESEEKRVKEEEERVKAEKEELERKNKEEAEKRETELQEKLRKEEEERLARKKRIEEIMARTRGKGGANTPKKEVKEESVTSQPEQPASLDTNVDPTKPDLLGDISDKVEAENAKNLANSSSPPPSYSSIPPSSSEAELEKGALDSISNKSEENENSSSLITIENGEEPVKKSNGVVEGVSFDQILDLDSLPDSNKAETDGLVGLPTPIIAFEESITQQNNTADLLS